MDLVSKRTNTANSKNKQVTKFLMHILFITVIYCASQQAIAAVSSDTPGITAVTSDNVATSDVIDITPPTVTSAATIPANATAAPEPFDRVAGKTENQFIENQSVEQQPEQSQIKTVQNPHMNLPSILKAG